MCQHGQQEEQDMLKQQDQQEEKTYLDNRTNKKERHASTPKLTEKNRKKKRSKGLPQMRNYGGEGGKDLESLKNRKDAPGIEKITKSNPGSPFLVRLRGRINQRSLSLHVSNMSKCLRNYSETTCNF